MFKAKDFTLLEFQGVKPKLHPSVFVADGVRLIGNVTAEKDVSFWYNVVCRGDVNAIFVGEGSNVQDGSVIHINYDGPETVLEKNVTIGHTVTLHGCTIKEGALVGMNSCILDGVVVGSGSFVAAGSLLTPGKIFPSGVLIQGSPGKVVRELTDKEIKYLKSSSQHYIDLKEKYRRQPS